MTHARVGEINYNSSKSKMTIIQYTNATNILVKFDDGYVTKCTYRRFQIGKVKSPYDKTVCGVGYTGEGVYKARDKDGNMTKQYKYWVKMLQRCYTLNSLGDKPTYEDKYVCEEWHNYQVFAKWFDENYYEIDGHGMDLDKDILYKGNKVYSPETSMFVPHRINVLFIKNDKNRGKYPVGVHYDSSRDKFVAQCSVLIDKDNKSTQKQLGRHKTPEEAFYKYKEFKEQYIKEVAEQYKDKIPQKLYDAMCKYVININD